MTTEQVIERAVAEGMTEKQIDRLLEVWIDTNIFRIGQGYAPLDLEDVMPRYVEVSA